MNRLLPALLVPIALGVSPGRAAEAPAFPTKPVRIIVPYAPGGGLDFIARLVQQPLNERWGVPVIVDNRPGASGMVGTQIVQRATDRENPRLNSSHPVNT